MSHDNYWFDRCFTCGVKPGGWAEDHVCGPWAVPDLKGIDEPLDDEEPA